MTREEPSHDVGQGWLKEAGVFFQPRPPAQWVDPVLFPIAIALYFLPDLIATQFVSADRSMADYLLGRLLTTPMAILLLLSGARLVGVSPVRDWGLRRGAILPSIPRGIVLALVMGPVAMGINFLVGQTVENPRVHPALDLLSDAAGWLLLTIVVNAVILAPIAEEMFFRGVVQTVFMSRLGVWPGLVAASVIFGLAHAGFWPTPIPLTLLGMALGLSFCRYNTLWTPIFFHAAFNGLNLFLVFSMKMLETLY